MSKFQQFWWYVGVALTSIGLIVSVFGRNMVLAVICAIVTTGLKKLQPRIEIPKVYAKRGIKKDMFVPGSTNK